LVAAAALEVAGADLRSSSRGFGFPASSPEVGGTPLLLLPGPPVDMLRSRNQLLLKKILHPTTMTLSSNRLYFFSHKQCFTNRNFRPLNFFLHKSVWFGRRRRRRCQSCNGRFLLYVIEPVALHLGQDVAQLGRLLAS
jgi:hypothetical protein